nr:protein kinase-like domain, phloem protein 2-like protein [Tanacetum cinerariifolium]
MEISMLSSLKHKNLVSLVGFCDENDEKIIIIRRENRGSLENYLSDPMLLTWVRRLEICVGLAHALSYIHYDEQRDFSVIHRHIDSEAVLLNENWEPKLYEFRLSMKIEASQRHLSFDTGTVSIRPEYTDPTYLETKSAHHKSDIYSFGIVMFELLCGRKAVIDENRDNQYLAQLAITHYREKKLNEIIDWDLLKQMDLQSFNIFAEIAYDCLNEDRSERPNIDEIVTSFEKALELQLEHHNAPFDIMSSIAKSHPMSLHGSQKCNAKRNRGWSVEATYIWLPPTTSAIKYLCINIISSSFLDTASVFIDKQIMSSRIHDLTHLKIPLENILSATNNFDDKNVIARGGYENRYKGELFWSGELIQITARRLNKDRNEMFWTEVSMLSSLKHQNLVSLVGFCDENGEKIIINRRQVRGSLDNYLSDAMLLTWVQRLKISVGLARVLSYIHYDEPRNFSVIHRDISVSTILLNDDFEPKLSSFEKSMKIEASVRHHSFHTSKVWCTNGYTDPAYEKTKSVNHKTDMYSFGIVLFELMCGRKSMIANDTNKYLAPAAILLYKEKKLNEIVDWDLWKQMDSQSFDIFAEIAYDCLNDELSQRSKIDEIVPRLEKALELARENRPLISSLKDDLAQFKIPLENILSATNNFDGKNIIGTTEFLKEYRGQHLWNGDLIAIYARRLNKEMGNKYERPFWMEISMLSSLKHKNLVSFIGFCDDNDEKIIIFKLETRGSLSNYLSDPMLLTWVQRLKICVGLGQALSYIHYDEPRDFSIIHRRIDSFLVQLNDNWEPKLSDSGLSMKIKASQRHHSFHSNTPQGTSGYGDPTYIETQTVSHKSDIYSFGVILFELLCGRKSIMDNSDGDHLAPLAVTHYQEKKLDNIIDEDLWKQMDLHSFNMFAEIAYECLAEERSRRPNIDDIVPRLEKVLELARENRPIHAAPNHLAHLRIPLEDIESATNNFDDKNVIGIIGFYKVYKGEVCWYGELIDISAWRLTDRVWDDEKEQQFWMEISMLSSLKHKNLVSIVGFCNEVGEETIIYKYESRGRLDNYLSESMLLPWVKRLEISVGIAHALSYLHYDEPRDFSVVHRNISSKTVRLNNDWEPKLTEFQHSMKIKASERHHAFHTDSIWSTKGYTDPTYLETGSVNHKSDIYSFGIVLFELLCGRESAIAGDINKYLSPVAIFNYREKTLDDIIDPDLWKQMDPQSYNVFAEIAYDCLNEERSQRPNIDDIVTRLEKALQLQLECQNKPEQLVAAAEVEGTSSTREKGLVTSISTGVQSHVSKKSVSSLKDLSHLKLSIEDVTSAANSFTHNFIRDFRFGKICEGRLLHSEQLIDIIAKWFPSGIVKDNSKKFWTEISVLSSLKHKNLVSVIGYHDEEDNQMIIYKKEAKGSLNKYLSDQTLTWIQRLKICLGVANALSYIHYDVARDFSVIHCNITSSKILLDDTWEPKLSGFELSLKNTVARRHRLLLTRDIVKNVYLDPKYKKTGGVTHKSDVYSFGVVLFEVLCGRSAVLPDERLGEGSLSQLAKSHIDDMIDPHLQEQMDPEAFKIFSETTYYCIQEERAKRPHIDQVVNKLEKALHLQWKRENPVDRTSFNRLKEKSLEHLKIGLDLINEATKNFDDAYCIGSGGFGKVYKADLEHFGSSNSSSMEDVNKCDLRRKPSTVAIKRIHNQEGEQGFIAEIETLTTCKHDNIISLLGFCYEGNGAMILVYEHASKGSLEDYLGSSDKMTNLSWMQRIKICLDIAHGLNYIHTNTDHDKQKIIHRDIKSANILLGDNWKAKIADFGLSKFHPANQEASTLNINTIAGTNMYLDPEYQKFGRLNKKSDIYSFGVVLFEILTGRLAYDRIFTDIDGNGIAPIARHHFEKGTLMEIVDPKIKEETDEHVFSLSKGPNKESLDIISEIAIRCIAETQVERPSIDVVINELKKALNFQENHKDSLKLSLEDIKLATQDFSEDNIIGHGDFGNVYRGATHAHGYNMIAAKWLNRKSADGEAEFMTELEILMEYKHENVIGLVGYCDEED